MPEKEHRFTVKADHCSVETLLSDFTKVYYLFPSFASAEKVEGAVRWHLKGPLKSKAGTPYLEARIEKREPGRIEWKADSPHLHWSGVFSWTGEGDSTSVGIHLKIQDTGPLGKVHETLISVQINNLVRYFERRLKEILEGHQWLNGLP